MSEVVTDYDWPIYAKTGEDGKSYIPDDAPQWAKDAFEEDKKKRDPEWIRENIKVE